MRPKLSILAPIRYPWDFAGPVNSKHNIERRRFVPFNYINPKVEGVTIFPPRFKRIDLIHAFNRIPIGKKPFVIGFESHLPRGYGIEKSRFFNWMRKELLADRCKAIVPISDFASKTFISQHENENERRVLAQKLIRRYPSIPITEEPAATELSVPIRLLFIGAHFARKGGLSALRAVERLNRLGVPVQLDIISKMIVGPESWTDPVKLDYFTPYWKLLDLPNVVSHGALPNSRVLKLIRDTHFVLLPTLGDTFGYSAVEALAQGVPPIVTNQGALPEFIKDRENGFMLDLKTDALGEWIHLGSAHRNTSNFEKIHSRTVDDLAQQIVDRLTYIVDKPKVYQQMKIEAYNSSKVYFSPDEANLFWDNLYESCV